MWGYSASQAARAATGKTRRRRATQTLSYDQFRPAEPEPRGWSRGYTGEFGGARLRMSNTLGGAPPMGPAIKEEVPMKPRGQIRSQAYAKSFGGGATELVELAENGQPAASSKLAAETEKKTEKIWI